MDINEKKKVVESQNMRYLGNRWSDRPKLSAKRCGTAKLLCRLRTFRSSTGHRNASKWPKRVLPPVGCRSKTEKDIATRLTLPESAYKSTGHMFSLEANPTRNGRAAV